MEEVEVQPVERIEDVPVPAGVSGPEYVLYGGKGGVGKTTMAAATGLASARDGTETLVVSTDPAHSLSDTFETKIAESPTRIREDDPLYAVEIDPESVAGPFGGQMDANGATEPGAGLGGLEELLGAGTEPLTGAMPGADEAAALQQLMVYLDDDRFERVIIDTAPTGHTLRLLELPELMDTLVGRMIRLRNRLHGMLEGMKGMFGDTDDTGGLFASEEWDQLQVQLERLRETLRDPDRTDFRVVLVPETMSIDESTRLIDRVTSYDIPVSTIVVNRIMEDVSAVTGVEVSETVGPDLEGCPFCRRRWKVQQTALERAQPLFRGRTVKRVPLFADEVRGETMLTTVAACLD